MAGPFERADFEKLVPADKKLSPEWVKSLNARGQREAYRGTDLARIGMPIGGICAGQLYLGGDGRLWHWDIFNQDLRTGDSHYAKPMPASSPVDQGFSLRVTADGKIQDRVLDGQHWRDVTFIGEYPIGFVEYADPECPLRVGLEAYSPFIPLNTDESSLPVTVLEFTVRNHSARRVEAELAGWLENAVCLYSGARREGVRRNRIVRDSQFLFLECSAEDISAPPAATRPDIVFDDFEGENYVNWTATGTAFGRGPVEAARMPEYQGDVGAHGKRLVNSHASAPGSNVAERDAATGKLTSRSFTIERNFINFLIGGGNHVGKTCLNLLIDGRAVLTATGANDNRLQPKTWDVRRWPGQTAQFEIVDDATGPWGNIGVDDIVLSDHPGAATRPLSNESDFGTLGLGLLEPLAGDVGITALPSAIEPAARPFNEKLVGSLTRKFKLAPGASAKATFVISWFMPNLRMQGLPPGQYYGTKFDSARGVAGYVAKNFARLSSATRLWHETWYDSTLPYWFLDRTFLNTSILATATCHRFANGRFYGWEGVGCCEGTCGHVWQYAHAAARLFPDLERETRERVDFGLALQPDGAIHFRGEFNNIPAIDAQAGTILRAFREHQMSPDDTWLRRNWPQIKRATEWLIAKDGHGDGIIRGNQHNTLDTDWYGPVAWLSGLYLAALAAAVEMADETGDAAFARGCREILERGRKNFVTQFFDGEYFINRVDPAHSDAINSGTGCHIDQAMGQSWAFQVGLPRVLSQAETRSALRSLWRYNFTPDVGPYRKHYEPGRWYAMPGEAGLLMCTFPRADWDYAQARGRGADWAAGYFNECMNGFEYQAAGHMIWEGMVTEGLAVTRAVHDRYHPSRRNPWNEIECGDHYARSMASYGVYLAACGFEYHGPKAHIGFAPRISPENFKCAFTSAEGWGVFSQNLSAGKLEATLKVNHGRLRVRSVSLEFTPTGRAASARVTINRKKIQASLAREDRRIMITLGTKTIVEAGQQMKITLA